jgi:hypothetical protein
MKISSNFDAGSIEIVSMESFDDIQLRIPHDNAADFAQWFYFRLQVPPTRLVPCASECRRVRLPGRLDQLSAHGSTTASTGSAYRHSMMAR